MRYDISRVIAHGRERVCCASADFLKEGQSIITLAHLLKREVGESMKQQLGKLPSDKARIRYIAEQTAEITGLHDFPQYLTLLFEIDSLILNDDRHLNNIAVLEQGGAYDYCPIFDNGAGLLSNMQVYNVGIEPGWLGTDQIAEKYDEKVTEQSGPGYPFVKYVHNDQTVSGKKFST